MHNQLNEWKKYHYLKKQKDILGMEWPSYVTQMIGMDLTTILKNSYKEKY